MKKNIFTILLSICIVSTINAQVWETLSNTPFQVHHAIGFSSGGFGYAITGSTTKNVYKYNPVTDAWNQLTDYPGPARGFGIGDAWDGKLYFGFGSNASGTSLNDLWEFDPSDESFTQLPNCPCAGRNHPAFVAHEGKIYMGMGNDFSNLKDWWVYDITNQSWTQGTDFPAEERHHPYQFAIGDYVYTGFGHGANIYNQWYRYDPSNDSWSNMGTLPAQGRVAGQQFSYNEKGYVLSGQGQQHISMSRGEFWEYDPILNTWTQLTEHPGNSLWAPTSFVIDNYVYISSGEIGNPATGAQGPSNTSYRYMMDTIAIVDTVVIVPNSIQVITEDLVEIFPNPTDNFINIKTDFLFDKITVYDISGKKVKSHLTSQNTIDVSSFSPGMYIIKLENKNNIITNRFVKN